MKNKSGKNRGKNGVALRYVKSGIIGIATGMANGLFGSGGGTIVVPAMVYLLDADDHTAHATAISVILPLTLVSAFFYIKGRKIFGAFMIIAAIRMLR